MIGKKTSKPIKVSEEPINIAADNSLRLSMDCDDFPAAIAKGHWQH
jgi:hypothetical protein